MLKSFALEFRSDEMTTMTGIIYLIIHSGLDAQEFRSDYF